MKQGNDVSKMSLAKKLRNIFWSKCNVIDGHARLAIQTGPGFLSVYDTSTTVHIWVSD